MGHASGTGYQFFANTDKKHDAVAMYSPAVRAAGASLWTKEIAAEGVSGLWTACSGQWNRSLPPRLYYPAGADIAFEAWGATPEELFLACADAVVRVLVNDPDAIEPRERSMLSLTGGACDIVLFSLLHELIVLKETQGLVVRIKALSITSGENAFRLKAAAAGEKIDRSRHGIIADVKALALHRLSVTRHEGDWIASVAFDILNA